MRQQAEASNGAVKSRETSRERSAHRESQPAGKSAEHGNARSSGLGSYRDRHGNEKNDRDSVDQRSNADSSCERDRQNRSQLDSFSNGREDVRRMNAELPNKTAAQTGISNLSDRRQEFLTEAALPSGPSSVIGPSAGKSKFTRR